MARRASSGINTKALLTGGLILVVLIAAGFFFFGRKKESFAKADPLVMSEFLAGSKMLAGNEYRVDGKVHDNRVSANGQIVTLKVENNGKTDFLPVLISEKAKSKDVNFVRGQDYAFLVRFDTDGVPEAIDVERH